MALFALAMGLALHANVETVSAQSGETVTTALQPGLNLAGWTEPEAPAAAIFEVVPALEAVYAWDAENQRYRLAIRTDAGLLGDLETLTPGMGLWLWLGGTGAFKWKRPLVGEASLVRLRSGWNFVAWSGEDGAPTDHSLGQIEGILASVAGGGGRALLTLTRGGAFWVKVSVDRDWPQQLEPPRHRRLIKGLVTDLSGNPEAGVSVAWLSTLDRDRHGEIAGKEVRDVTGSDGSFEIMVPRGHHRIAVILGGTNGYYEYQRGLTPFLQKATRIDTQDFSVSGILIRYGVITVNITGLRRGEELRVGLQEGGSTYYVSAASHVEFMAPQGTFLIGVYCPDFRLVGYFDGDGGLVNDSQQAAPIIMEGADISLALSVSAATTCR
ncbi:MAG: hypothetical protein OXE43_00970 [Chloroflexi bacterium]|nr:hypothetical protein [Chloroflexota bacterium]